jgi:uncharacterized membrane protein YfcA
MEPETAWVSLGALESTQMWLLLPIGLLAGLLGGLLGLGGGVITMPALILVLHEPFGRDSFHAFKLAAILTTLALSVPSVVRHGRAAGTVPDIIRGMLPLAALGAVGSVALSMLFVGPYAHVLQRLFGVFLLALAAYNEQQLRVSAASITDPDELDAVRRGFNLRTRSPAASRGWVYGLAVGLPSGLLAGLLGVGGGVWAVPGQHVLLGVRMRYAIGNSAVLVLLLATVTAVAQSLALTRIPGVSSLDGLQLAAFLVPGAALGGWVGAGLSHRMPRGPLRRSFYWLLAIVGIRLAVF